MDRRRGGGWDRGIRWEENGGLLYYDGKAQESIMGDDRDGFRWDLNEEGHFFFVSVHTYMHAFPSQHSRHAHFFFFSPQTNLKPLPFSDPSSPFAKKRKREEEGGKNAAERMKT